MIQANVAAAETLEAKRAPLVYRVHDQPSKEKLEALREFLATLDLRLPPQGSAETRPVQPRSRRRARAPPAELVNEVVLRAQARPTTSRRTSATSASTSGATRISPRRSGATPTSSSTAR